MVNGTVDKNNICTNSKPDEESIKQSGRNKAEVVSASSSDCVISTSNKSSNFEASSERDHEKTGITEGEAGSGAMAEVPTKTSLFCSVPLNKIRSVLSNTSGKIDEDENSVKFTQISRKLLCLYCDRTFVSSNLRQKHVERCHSEKQSRRLSSRKLQSQFTTTACFHCDKLPAEHSLRQLFEHLVSTHSQKYFGCLLCEERFLNQIQLNDHNTKLHNSLKKQMEEFHLVNINEGLERTDKANEISNSSTEVSSDKDQKLNKIKKKDSSKPPPRKLRNKKKVSIKASKVGLKRSTRLQSAQNKVSVRKKRTKAVEKSKSVESNTKPIEKVKGSSINPYPEFDSYYRVKKITDHSIDNLKISSLTFDDVFDKAFFNRIKCNIQENLLYYIDGKLFKNEESESRISNFEKYPPSNEVSSTTSENFGCDLSLNAVTPVTSISAANFGEDLELQIEYGSKPSKKKLQVRQDPVRHKYVTRRKYQASILEHKENRDLSKLDMWTQLVIQDRQQKVLNGKKSAKEMLEYKSGAEYKLKIQRNELNRILDRRGPFEDLKEEASKKAALEQLGSYTEMSEECFKEVRFLMEDLLAEIVKNLSKDEEKSTDGKLSEKAEFLEKEDIPVLPEYLKLRRTSSLPSEEEIDKSDKIALICSSQETENYELPTNTVRNKNEMIELSGEWARSRIYVCAACGLKVSNMKLLIDHKSMYHQNSWVQHYELVGNQSELYRHLCIPGLGKVGYIEEAVPCKSWLKSDSRVCTKCGKVCNSLSELHRHILECGGDWTWMLARKKCKYRPFGARKKRRGLVKRIRESSQKTDQTEKKKYKKTFEGPRQRPSDADTIQRMLANLPLKRSSRKIICMKDGFSRKRQKSPDNKKQVMKCGKIVRQKSTYNTNLEATKITTNHKKASIKKTLRSISRTLSSKILDTNSKLKVKRQLIQNINRRSPRRISQNVPKIPDLLSIEEETKKENQKTIKKIISSGKSKNKTDLDKVTMVLKEKVNIKSFFPVSKRKASRNIKKPAENPNSDSSQHSENIEANKEINPTKHKPAKKVMEVIKKSLKRNKQMKPNLKNASNLGGNSEPIVVIEKLTQTEQIEAKAIPSSTSKKVPNKRKLRSSFRKVIDKVKKLKLDNSSVPVHNDKNIKMNKIPINSFLGQVTREKEKLATVLIPLVEELKENPLSNLAFVQNAMDNNTPTEESLIPENIFNLQHNSEDLLQAKSPLDTLTNEVKIHEENQYLNIMSAKVSHLPQIIHEEATKRTAEIEMQKVIYTKNENDSSEDTDATLNKDISMLTIETAPKSDKSPLVSPIMSPLLSPKMKGKLRKPSRGLNDCIAMLTKKAFEETHKPETVQDLVKSVGKPSYLDNTIEAHKTIRTNECILKIPVIETHSKIQTEVLDLSKPKRGEKYIDIPEENNRDLPPSKSSSLWKPVLDILSNNLTSSIDDLKIKRPMSSSQVQTNTANLNVEKAILKIPKYVEISRSNNVDNIIQGVIENYDEPVNKSETIKPYSKVSSVVLLNSVDEIIEEVVKGNLSSVLNEENSIVSKKSSVDKKSMLKEDKIITVNTTSEMKKATKKNKKNIKSSNENKTSIDLNISSYFSDQSEPLNTMHGGVKPLDVPKLISTSSAESVSQVKGIDNSLLGVHLSENKSSEKFQKDEESDSAMILVENKISSNSEKKDAKSVDVLPVKITCREQSIKKNSQRKKKITKDSLKKIHADIKVETNYSEEGINNSKQADIFEEELVPSILDKIILAGDLFSIKATNSKLYTSSETVTESNKLLEEDSSEHDPQKKCAISFKESNENQETSSKPVSVHSTVYPDKSQTSIQNNLKNNSTDSEDELPLLLLKSRSRKQSLKEIPEGTAENTVTIDNAVKLSGLLESQEENTESCKNEIIEKPESTEINGLLTSLITDEFPYPTKNEEHSHSDSSVSRNNFVGTLQSPSFLNQRKSTRKTRDSKRQEKNSKKFNKGVNSKEFEFKSMKNSDEVNKNGEILGIISKAVEIEKPGECSVDTLENAKPKNSSEDGSDVVVFNNIPMEANMSLKTTDKLEAFNKPKNFLLDTNVCNFRNDIKNTPLKSPQTKKNYKIEHDSIKTRLIFKFPKIILKEPVLRIPPRDSISEGIASNEDRTDNSKDKSIELMLENPFSNTKMQEEKHSSVPTLPEILKKTIKNNAPAQTKSSSKKKSNKRRKRLSKALVAEGGTLDVSLHHFQDANPEESITSSFSHEPTDKTGISDSVNVQSSPDDSNIASVVQHSSNTLLNSFSGSTELQEYNYDTTLKLPITLKLQESSLKKCKTKIPKKKKDKVKISSGACNEVPVNGKIEGDKYDISSRENIAAESEETKMMPKTPLVENMECIANTSISKNENYSEFRTETNELMSAKPVIPHERLMSTDKAMKLQSHNSKWSTVNSADEIAVKKEEDTPVKSSRSLRSTVKITYKQSNIFALQIEDREIADLKIIEKPKYVESSNVSSNDLLSLQAPNLTENYLTTHQHEKIIMGEAISNHDLFEQDGAMASNGKISNSKKRADSEEVLTKNEKIDEMGFTTSIHIMNVKESDESEDDQSLEGNPKVKLSEMGKRVNIGLQKSRRSTKKVPNKTLDINLTKSTKSTIPIKKFNYDDEVGNEFLDDTNIENETFRGIWTDCIKENIEEKVNDSVLPTYSKISVETNEEKQFDDSVVATSCNYEDSCFSEGELVINESFESLEGNIFDESSDSCKKLEIIDSKTIDSKEETVQTDIDSTSDIGYHNNSQKTKRHKKERSSKSPKKLNSINHSLKANPDNPSKGTQISVNEIETDKKLVTGMNESTSSDLNLKGTTENTFRMSRYEQLVKKSTDQFEFDDLTSKFLNSKTKYANCQDVAKKSSLGEEKSETTINMFHSSAVDGMKPSLGESGGRRQRTAKSKALENISIIEKKLDQILDTELANNEKPSVSLKYKKKIAKRKESVVEHKIQDNYSTGMICKEPLIEEGLCEINCGAQRKSRAAKVKAIENLKVSEIKANHVEEGIGKIKKSNIPESSEKVNETCKSKDENALITECKEKNMLNFRNLCADSAQEQLIPVKNKNLPTIISLTSSGLSPNSIDECPLVLKRVQKSMNGNEITENSPTHESSDFQCDLSKGEKKSTKVKRIGENDLIYGNQMSEMDDFKNPPTLFDTDCFEDSFSKNTDEANLNIHQKRKRSDGDGLSGNARIVKNIAQINCCNIENILEDKGISSCRTKRKKKPIKNDKETHIDHTEETFLNASIEAHIEKSETVAEQKWGHNQVVSKETGILETECDDSLDVTLKTTADEISSILMEDKYINEIPNASTKSSPTENITSKSGNKDYVEKHSGEPKSTQILEAFSVETLKKKKYRHDGEKCSSTGSEKATINMGAKAESGNKRRSRRACKVNTYNENFLAEAIFDQVASEKDKANEKTPNETTDSPNAKTTKKGVSDEIFQEKKMNSDELFDLLKATAPDNLIALKPVEENPCDTPHTDDQFDDDFDEILRKSQALFGDKPYKKLDDICRSDDSSSTSKLTHSEKLEENDEPNSELVKSMQSFISETTFSNSILPVGKNEHQKSEYPLNCQSDDLYCGICRRTFKRIDNLIKHRTTLTHIAKLSEMEAKLSHDKLRVEEQGIEDSCTSDDTTVDSNRQTDSGNYPYPPNAENNASKIITEAFEEPAAQTGQGFSEVVLPLLEYRRYKSLGERKSFEYDQGSQQISKNMKASSYESKISNSTGIILEKQITLLQNIVGFDCANDASTSSFHSLKNSIDRDSPVSVFSSKLEDSTNLVFANNIDLEGEAGRSTKHEGFLKPPQIEDISEDSVNMKNSEDVKSRKVLNRDEELFLECCSLLKSGSEVSNFSKKSNRNSLLNNVSIKIAEEPDVLESKNVIYTVKEDSFDYSTRATPLGDSFGDASNSNTISSSWEMNKNDQPHKSIKNLFSLTDNEKYNGNNESSFDSPNVNNLVYIDTSKSFSSINRKSTKESEISNKGEENSSIPSSNMPTKGALKIFEGLKVSIPTDELNLEMLKKKSKITKTENNVLQKVPQEFSSSKTPRRKSKPVKNKPQIDERFIFKVNKKPILKDTEQTISNISKECISNKITDVYDFEETQDNTDVFAKPDYKSFRTKGTETGKGEVILENNYEVQNMSSSSSSTLSSKKTNECITKKKHMIMGRIFKNAVKPKLGEDIRNIPPIDHNELVENYVMSCTPKHEEEFKKPKMTEEEMNYLFDKLLDKPSEQPKKSVSPSKTDCKNNVMKKKLKMKCKKRQRSNSDSTDDEFGLNKIVKKRPSRKNAKEEDNSINLEQELKECIGVASRKSQRKCTSGKQNVLVEYWSSDESAFETFLENHLQELAEKSDISQDTVDKQENDVSPCIQKENLFKIATCEKNKKPKPKHKVFPKKKEAKDPTISTKISDSSVQSNRRKRTAAHPLYHWSSSSEDELQDLIEVKSLRDDPEDEYDEERPVQHGWIVGDSPKKLVTMLAQAKGKKTEPESFVKEQGKKKNSNS